MLKNKLELVGGTIEVRSNENEGTTVRMELPAGDTV
jgi:signal transduction histidine kinase